MHRFVAPAIIAAAVHGVILVWPRAPLARLTPAAGSHPIADPTPFVQTVDLASADDADDGGGGENSAPQVARLPDAPTADATSAFVVPVQPEPVGPMIPGVDRIPAVRWTGGTGVGDGPQGIIAAIGALDYPPRARVQIPPEYPSAARSAGLTGEVVIEFVVTESGQVIHARIARSTDPVFDSAALKAVARWRFEPGTIHNRVVRFRMAVPLEFRLND